MAQEKVLRIAMTAADIPRTLGQPDQGFEGNRFTGIPMYDALTHWDLSKADAASVLIPGLATSWKHLYGNVDSKVRQSSRLADKKDFNSDFTIDCHTCSHQILILGDAWKQKCLLSPYAIRFIEFNTIMAVIHVVTPLNSTLIPGNSIARRKHLTNISKKSIIHITQINAIGNSQIDLSLTLLVTNEDQVITHLIKDLKKGNFKF